jgi:hypothetical protein
MGLLWFGAKLTTILELYLLHNKRVCPTKNEPQQQGISYLERQERERGGQAGGQESIFKVRLGFGEIEGRDRDRER